MSGAVSDKPEAFNPPPAGEFLGHPKALWNLFGSEFWERFMYYGMRAMLAVHVAAAFFSHLGPGADAQASVTYGGFTSLVYMTGILGGYVADRILGYQRSIMLGGVLMAIGSYMLMAPDLTTFVMGLAVIVVGNGLFKPNISTMVGKLYAPGDARRDSGFTIFYMGINAGALVAPIICSAWIGANYGYRWGFFAAGTGMLLGLVVFQALKAWLGHVGTAPAGREGMGNVGKVLVGALLLAVPAYFLLDMGWQNAFAERFAADGVFGMLLRKLGILGLLPRIGGQVCGFIELGRVHEDRHHHAVVVRGGCAHERQVPLVQCPHRGHHPNAARPGGSSGLELRLQLLNRAHDFHDAAPLPGPLRAGASEVLPASDFASRRVSSTRASNRASCSGARSATASRCLTAAVGCRRSRQGRRVAQSGRNPTDSGPGRARAVPCGSPRAASFFSRPRRVRPGADRARAGHGPGLEDRGRPEVQGRREGLQAPPVRGRGQGLRGGPRHRAASGGAVQRRHRPSEGRSTGARSQLVRALSAGCPRR
mgnify:CR=1 FL=1